MTGTTGSFSSTFFLPRLLEPSTMIGTIGPFSVSFPLYLSPSSLLLSLFFFFFFFFLFFDPWPWLVSYPPHSNHGRRGVGESKHTWLRLRLGRLLVALVRPVSATTRVPARVPRTPVQVVHDRPEGVPVRLLPTLVRTDDQLLMWERRWRR